MEEGMRSRGGFVKKKNSSGCLIIKRKGDGPSRSRKVFEQNKEKKRPRLVPSDSESSGELSEPFGRKVVTGTDRFRNGSVLYREDIVEDGNFGGNGETESDRKRRFDVFEFDEYDGMDGKRMRKDYLQDRLKLTGRSMSEIEFETGSSRSVMIDKRKHSYFDRTSNSLGGKREVPVYTYKGRFEIDDDEAHLPISSLTQKFRVPSDEPIRLQGKNGVLKVMVNKKKKTEQPHKFNDPQLEVGDRMGSNSEKAIKKNTFVRSSFYSDSKPPEKEIPLANKENSERKLRKPSSMSAKSGNSETEDNSDTSLKLGPTSMQARSSSRKVRSEGKAPSAKKITPSRKEGKVKRGNGTEKQLLREKIRSMLISAGWTIDYRPRRNRDYLDAVYINPTGTAYWSIIKAYDALQKQLEEDDVDIKPSGHTSSFTPLPEELVSKLTRQTRKKIEKEMKMKMKMKMKIKRRGKGGSKNVKGDTTEESVEGTDEDKDNEKLCFFMKRNGKSKGRCHETTRASGDDSSGTLYKESPDQEMAEKPSTATNSHVIQARKSRKIGRCTLLVRSSDKGLNSEGDGYIPYTGKRTLLSWLIDSGTVHLSEKVQYMNRRRTKVMLEGWITRDGVHCGCCSKILTVSKFEIHAASKLRQPFQNIYLESGISLLQCQIDAWNRQEESKRSGFHTVDVDGDDPNDDTCGLCGDGGDLICCDGCPSTFHQSCLDIQMLPPGDWHCPNCTCKFCGIGGESSARGNGATVGALLRCSLCEKRYHEHCGQEMNVLPADSNYSSTSFCGQKCRELFDHLQKLLGVKHELEAGFSWSLIHRTDLDPDALHRGFPQKVECNSKLAVALSVMDECFLPIVDRRSGINLIHNVLYNCGSNFSRLNYSGFYTAILERGDEIISAASIRIRGAQLAEMPFIGTRHIYRRQGMCRRLFCAIESALRSLKVEKLIIPAIAEHMHTWTIAFGFNPLEESHKQEMRSINMLVFPGTDMLQKLLGEQKIVDGNITITSGAESVPIKNNHHTMPDLAKKSDVDSSAGDDLNLCDDASLHNADEINGKADAVDSSLQVPDVCSNDNECLNSSFDVPSEPKLPVLNEKMTNSIFQLVEKSTESSAGLKQPPSSDVNHVNLEMENPLSRPSVEGESSTVNATDQIKGDQNSLSVSIVNGTNEPAAQTKGDQNSFSVSIMNGTHEAGKDLDSDASPHSSFDMESKLEISSEAKVEPVIVNIRSSAEGYEDGAQHAKDKVSCAEPVLDNLDAISAQNTAEKINEILDPVSVSSHGTDKCVLHFTSDVLRPDSVGTEGKLNAACGDRVTPVEGIVYSSAVGKVDDIREVNGKAACIEPDIDCLGENSAQNKNTKEGQDPASISTPDGSESTLQYNSDLNWQSSLEMENNLLAASEVASDEEVAPVGNNTLPNPEDDANKDAHKHVADDSVKPVLNSSGETSVENATEDTKENDTDSTSH